MKNNIESTLKKQLLDNVLSTSVFKNEKYLSKNYFPTTIDFREKEFHQLAIFFKEVYNLKEKSLSFFQTVTLFGPIGSGKSTVAKIFGKEVENFSQQNNLPFKIIYRHINCRRNNSIFLILFNLMRNLIPNFPNRGFSPIELLNMLHILLNSSNNYLVLTLDEIDFVFNDKELDLFFQNIAMNDFADASFFQRRISLIFITRNKEFLLLMDPNNKFGIINNLIKFESYSKDELKWILFKKSNDAFNDGVLSLKTLDLIVSIAEEIEDLRIGIELLWRAGKNCELLKSISIEENHVKKALKMILFPSLEGELEFDENDLFLLRLLAQDKKIFKINQPLNIKKVKKLLINDQEFMLYNKDNTEDKFNLIVEKFTKLRIFEKVLPVKNENEKNPEPSYYLKMSPDLILKCI